MNGLVQGTGPCTFGGKLGGTIKPDRVGLDHPDHIFGTILDVYAAAGSTRTNDFIDNSRPCDPIRKLCGSSHNTPKFVTYI